jgi:hypothetical protein
VIRISITLAAFGAIASTLPLGSVSFEQDLNAKGERFVWLAPNVVDRLTAMRERGESFSDVILRLVELEAGRGARSQSLASLRGRPSLRRI